MTAFCSEGFQLPDQVRQQLGDSVARDEIPAAFQFLRQQRLPFAPCLTRRTAGVTVLEAKPQVETAARYERAVGYERLLVKLAPRTT